MEFKIEVYTKTNPIELNRLHFNIFLMNPYIRLQEVPEDNYDLPYHHHHNHPADAGEAVMIKIDASMPLREEPRYPKEKWKTVMCK